VLPITRFGEFMQEETFSMKILLVGLFAGGIFSLLWYSVLWYHIYWRFKLVEN
jgi:hypothetical protein